MQKYVTQAETHGGGWVVLSFHGICSDSCTGDSSFSPTTFAAFLDWLKARQGSGTVVKMVGEVMGGGGPAPASPPVTTIKCSGAARTTAWYLTSSVTVDLTATGTGGSGVAKVVFKDGTTTLKTDTSSPYNYNWSSTKSVGAHTVTAIATDVAGNVTSTALTVNIIR